MADFMGDSSFSVSVDATSYIYASEIFPTHVRAKGLSLSISGLFIATIIFLQSAPTAFESIGWKYYVVFIVITAIMFVVVWLYFPEVRLPAVDAALRLGIAVDWYGRLDRESSKISPICLVMGRLRLSMMSHMWRRMLWTMLSSIRSDVVLEEKGRRRSIIKNAVIKVGSSLLLFLLLSL
jgi:MFS family permease